MMRRALRSLAQLMVRGPHREFVLGDLEDGYERLRASKGSIVAIAWFFVMLLRSAYAVRRRPFPSGGPTVTALPPSSTAWRRISGSAPG